MIDDLAIWFMCNPMQGNLALCAVNSILIYPGIFGLFSVLLVYIVGIPLLIWMQVKGAVKLITERFGSRKD